MTYQDIDAICCLINSDLCAAEAHGVATGMLCIKNDLTSELWLNELIPSDFLLEDDARGILHQLFATTESMLASDQYEFVLCLPEEYSLTEQVYALAGWCRGFLFGIGAVMVNADLSRNAKEILKDFFEFTKMEISAEGEEEEAAFTEITEYIKAAVYLLKEEITPKANRILH